MKLLLQMMNLELRKERKEKKGTPRENLLFYCYCYSFRTSRIVDQTSTFSGPGHFLVATGDRASAKF